MDVRKARREYKFLLHHEQARAVFDEIRGMLPNDRNGSGGAYPIVSEYYDTPEHDAYWERDRKVGNRRKLRVRIYGTANGTIPPAAFLEVKHKREGVGVKRRIAVPVAAVTRPDLDIRRLICDILPTLTRKADQLLAEEILLLLDKRGVLPAVQMRYDRVAFEGLDREDEVRITFDQSIRCRAGRKQLAPDDADFPYLILPEDAKLLEVKLFGAAPYWLRELVAKHRITRSPFSKYCGAVDALRPVLARRSQEQKRIA